jgi:Arc/MetJ family transcription regulator
MKHEIEIDDSLLTEALEATGLRTRHELVELALKMLIQIKHQQELQSLRGKMPWDGDLEAMRRDA